MKTMRERPLRPMIRVLLRMLRRSFSSLLLLTNDLSRPRQYLPRSVRGAIHAGSHGIWGPYVHFASEQNSNVRPRVQVRRGVPRSSTTMVIGSELAVQV